MSRIGLLWAALALGSFSSSLAAQQTSPDQPLPPLQQTSPAVPPAPPPDTQTSPEAPPPFPPMPSAPPRHRWVDMGNHRAAHPRRHAGHARRNASHAHRGAAHATRKTMRWCRSIDRREMLRHGTCRRLMHNQSHETHHHGHPASHRPGLAHRRTAVHRHSPRLRRGKHHGS